MKSKEILTKEYIEFIKLLNFCGVDYLIAGGFRVLLDLKPRMIGDLDILVGGSMGNAARLAQAISRFRFGNADPRLTSEDFLTSIYVIRLGYKPNRIDLIDDPSPISFDKAWHRRGTARLDSINGVLVNFLDREDVVERQRLAERPRDLGDIESSKHSRPFDQRLEREMARLKSMDHEPDLTSKEERNRDEDLSPEPRHDRDLPDPDDDDFDL